MPFLSPNRRSGPPSTAARIGLSVAGVAVPVREHLRFQLDHALARDAVQTPLDTARLMAGVRERGGEPVELRSKAADRATYLRRPDLGRRLSGESVDELERVAAAREAAKVLFVLADGLSALAVERHALPLLDAVRPLVGEGLGVVPVLTNARVAIADEVGERLGASMTVLLIGERPGLSSHDSLGCYLTWGPRVGRTDADRNCISNIRGEEGLGYVEAAERIAYYLAQAARVGGTGTMLKDPGGARLLDGR